MNDPCMTCQVLRQVCTHDPGNTTGGCWQGKHTASCSGWCQCDCHKGAYPLTQNNALCLQPCRDIPYTCSLPKGHPGRHAAYRGHDVADPDDYVTSWDNALPVSDDEVQAAIESIKGVRR